MVVKRKRSQQARLARMAALARGPATALFSAPAWLRGQFKWQPSIYGGAFDVFAEVRSDREFRTRLQHLSNDVSTLVLAPGHGTADGFVLWGRDTGPSAVRVPLHKLIETVFAEGPTTIDRLHLHACCLGRGLVDACR